MANQSEASKAGQLLGRLGKGKPKTMSPSALAARRKGALISARNRLGRSRQNTQPNTQNTQREHAEGF